MPRSGRLCRNRSASSRHRRSGSACRGRGPRPARRRPAPRGSACPGLGRRRAAGRARHGAGGAWSRSCPASGPAPGLPAPVVASRVLVGTKDHAVEHPQPLVGHAAAGDSGQHRLEHAKVAPAGEAAPDRVPPAVALGNGSPTGTLARLYRMLSRMHRSSYLRLPGRPGSLGSSGPTSPPFRVRQVVRRHPVLPPWPNGRERPQSGAVPFVHTAWGTPVPCAFPTDLPSVLSPPAGLVKATRADCATIGGPDAVPGRRGRFGPGGR
jgi:hypothetical protein